MITAPAARVVDPPATLTAGLRALLAGFAGAPGAVLLEARSAAGFGHEVFQVDPRAHELPTRLLILLEDQWGIEVGPVTHAADGTPAVLAYAFACWRVPLDFSAETAWRRRPQAAAVDAIATALRGFESPPSFVFDGVHTLAALWELTAPLDVRRDGARAVALQRALATRLVSAVAL